MPRSDPQQTNYLDVIPAEAIAAVNKLPRKWKGIEIPAQILVDRRLSPAEKILFGLLLITDASDEGSFWSNESITNLLDISHPVVSKAYAKFKELGLATVDYCHRPGRTIRTVRSLVKIGIMRDDTLKESLSDTPRKVYAKGSSYKEPNTINKTLKPSRLRAADRRTAKTPSPKKHYPTDSLEFQLAMLQVSLIRQWNETFPRPNIDKWAADFDFLLNIRKFTYPRIEAVLRFWQADEFWRDKGAGDPNYLRRPKKFDELEFKAISTGKKKPGKAFGRQSGYQVDVSEYSRVKTHIAHN